MRDSDGPDRTHHDRCSSQGRLHGQSFVPQLY